jgi:hypothetical protein
MGMVHKTVVDSCDEYFAKMRRHVYQTPKSFLQVRIPSIVYMMSIYLLCV